MTITDQQRQAAYVAPEREFHVSDWECSAGPGLAGIPPVARRDDERERLIAARRHEAARTEAERRLLAARGTGALGAMMSPR